MKATREWGFGNLKLSVFRLLFPTVYSAGSCFNASATLTIAAFEHLTADEVKALLQAAGERGRHKERDRTLLLLMFRHGLRPGTVRYTAQNPKRFEHFNWDW